MNLDPIYDRIDSQNQRPKAQLDAAQSDLYTRALWTMGNWTFPNVDFLKDLTERLGTKGLVFNLDNTYAKLHWTLLQFQTFPISPNQTLYNDVELVPKIRAVLDRYPPLHITFQGIARTRFGLFLRGHPNYNVNQLRDDLRAICPSEMVEPHPQDICHSTLFRFTQEPTEDDLGWLNTFVSKYKDVVLGTMRPNTWEFGYGTWAQRDADRIVKATWTAKPSLWILHRGLQNGPDKALENKEELLWDRIKEGWDVEVDCWFKEDDGSIWLGHDKPTILIQNMSLLSRPKAWIHCKNLAMLQYMVERKLGAPFFSHDVDQAILTSNGYMWCYPGFQAGIQSIVVMPERVPDMMIDYSKVGGVCSDYTQVCSR
jgi:hypothetical protein